VADAIRTHSARENPEPDGPPAPEIDRMVIGPDAVTIRLVDGRDEDAGQTLTAPWRSKRGAVQCNSVDTFNADGTQAKNLDALLIAIAEARVWVEELTKNQVTIAQIAKREGKGERYIRLLLPLAFTAPIVVATLLQRTASTAITLTQLAAYWPPSWKLQAALSTYSPQKSGRPDRDRYDLYPLPTYVAAKPHAASHQVDHRDVRVDE
jgi:hypothetical protein